MPWEYLVDQTIGPVRLRVAATVTGFVVTKVSPGSEGQSLRITRQRFGAEATTAIGHHCLEEALNAGEQESTRLRESAQQAIRKVHAARETMRVGCGAIKRLEHDAVNLTRTYLTHSQLLAQACAQLEQALDGAGFPTGERLLPPWIERVFENSPTSALAD